MARSIVTTWIAGATFAAFVAGAGPVEGSQWAPPGDERGGQAGPQQEAPPPAAEPRPEAEPSSTPARPAEGAPSPEPAAAPAAPLSRAEAARARYHIRVMEGVLERAVQHGAQLSSEQLRTVASDLVLFTGPARARGFKLDGYGVFFDVDVPALRQSASFVFRTLNRGGAGIDRALQSIKRYVSAVDDEQQRGELEQALRVVELQIGPVRQPGAPTTGPGVRTATDANVMAAGAPAPAVVDPGAAYTALVKSALIDAMIDYGTTLNLGAEDWLTVAARDNEDLALPGELSDAVTITLRVKGSDLAAYRAERISRDEIRRRVAVTEF